MSKYTLQTCVAFIVLILVVVTKNPSFAQSAHVMGPTAVNKNETHTYTVEFRDLRGRVVAPPSGTATWTAAGGQVMSSTSTSANIKLISNTGIYYELQSSNNYYSGHINVTVNQTMAPSPPVSINHGSRCDPGTVVLSASPGTGGTTIRWYLMPRPISHFHQGNSYTTPALSATRSYYVSSYNTSTGAESAKVEIKAVVNTTPGKPTVNVSPRFGEGTVSVTASGVAQGGTYRWYNSASGSLVQSGPVYTTPPLSASVDNYVYVRADIGGCLSEPVYVGFVIVPLPEITASSDRIIMGSEVTLQTTIDYDSYQWKNSSNQIVGTSKIFKTNTPGVYTVTVTKNGVSGGGKSASITLKEQLSGQNMNFVVSNVVQKKDILSENQIGSLDAKSKMQAIQYYDGLGRNLQSVVTQGSPSQHDIVQPILLNQYGQEPIKYLPFVPSEGNGRYKPHESILDNSTGNYKGIAQTYAAGTNNKIVDESMPFSATIFEASPLGRPVEIGSPGAEWQPGTGRTNKLDYRTNTTGEVRQWEYTFGINVFGTVTTKQFYQIGQLYVSERRDEHDRKTFEYTNQLGQVVQKKVQQNDVTNSDADWLITSYVYDDFGNLRLVIPPQGYATLAFPTSGTYTLSTSIRDQWCFYYHYDERQRMIEKKVPGAAPVHMVYDQWDRLVLVQDGEQRLKKGWLYTKYDALNRPISTGIYTDQENRSGSVIQEDIKSETVRYESLMPQPGASSVYTNESFPNNDILTLSETYYDDYAFLGAFGWDSEDHSYTYIDDQIGNLKEFDRVKGLVTGGKVRVIDTDTWLNSVNYYDDRYRVIQATSENYTGGTDRMSMQYDFVGKVLKTVHSHTGYRAVKITQEFEYDHAGRHLKTYHQVDNNDRILLASSEYNELGELVDKKLHATNAAETEFLQSVDFRYNIRGWLTSINNSAISDDNGLSNDDPDDFFGMELYYNQTASGITSAEDLQYNGNISAVKWNNLGKKGYKYSYDNVSRLTGASYFEDNGSLTSTGKYNVGHLDYDKNGNILNLKRFGADVANPIDHLSYDYGTGSNKSNRLLKVGDSGTEEGFKNGTHTDSDDYDYYENGNLKMDKNKDIASIAYNHLNLPSLVTFTNGNTIAYAYDAAGTKLRKTTKEGDELKVTDYSGVMIYDDEVLQFVQHGEGRIMMSNEDGLGIFPEYQYHLKDHLGNVRLTFTSEPKTDTDIATMETVNQEEEYSEFLYYENATIINSELFDHTKTEDTHYAIRLNGSEKERIGLVKSLSVMPGDVINAEVHVKYIDTKEKANWAPALQGLIASIINGTAAVETFFEGPPVPAGQEFPYPDVIDKTGDVSVVKAYLNYIVFDKDRNLIEDKSGYKALTKGKENGDIVAHDELITGNIYIDEPGFVYIYLSNENPEPYDVFFDDFKVEHIQSPIVQSDDYYPFGLTFNSYKRENRIGNKFLFNGVELDSKTKSYETSFRGYDPSLGRFMQIDPLADVIPGISTYHFGYNNPIKYADPLGLIGEQDMWGRDKFDDNGAFIPSIDRPGGALCSGCGDQSKGRWEAVETPLFTLDYSTHVDTDGNGSYDYNTYSYTVSSETNYKWVFDDFNKYSSPGRNDGSNAWYTWFRDDNMGGKIAKELNEFNPLALAANGLKTYFTGTDFNGAADSNLGATVKIANAFPFFIWGRVVNVLGSTGRVAAASLAEQLAMREAVSNPAMGRVVMEGLTDPRWAGWSKLEYVHRGLDGSKITIHYVGKFENGVLKWVDDFKFKN